MKKYFPFLILALLLANPAMAKEKTDRKGFFLDFAPLVGVESSTFEKAGGGLSLQLGSGINERLVLMGSTQAFLTSVSDVDFTLSAVMFKAQYFPVEASDFYIGGGLGFSMLEASSDTGFGTLTANSDIGLGLEASVGYQFRTGKKFYIAPEFNVNYASIESVDFLTSAVALRLGWYF